MYVVHFPIGLFIIAFHDDGPPSGLIVFMIGVERGDGRVAMRLDIQVPRISWPWIGG